MRLHARAATLLPLLLLVLLPPVRGAVAQQCVTQPACSAAPSQVTNFANGSSQISSVEAMGDALFFASYDPVGGTGLWKAATVNGSVVTTRLRAWPGTVSLARLTAADGLLYFVVNEGLRTALWSTDGTSTSELALFQNTSLITGVDFAVMGRTLFFMAATEATGFELWKSDGTATGTRLVKDINPGGNDAFPSELTVLKGKLFFAADDGSSGTELWVSDGVPDGAGTHRVKDIRTERLLGSNPSSLRVMGDKLFFTAATGAQAELWTSDGTEAGTQVAVSAKLGDNHSPLEELTVVSSTVGSALFFRMDDQRGRGEELWRSDGTEAGTNIVKELQVGAESSSPQNLVAVGGTLFFMASDGQTGRELWKTDGTAAGTVLVRDFVPGSSNPPGGELLVPGAGSLLVAINDNCVGQELWRVNQAGAERLTDIISGMGGSEPQGMTVAGDRLYFVATYPGVGQELAALPLNQVDCTPPQPVCPADLRVEAVSPLGAFVFIPSPKEERDDSLTPLLVEYSPQTPGIFPLADTLVLITVKDAANNTAQCWVRVTVEDTMAPALVCPRRLVQEATGPAGTPVFFPVRALDAVTAQPSVSYSRGSGSLFPLAQEVEVEATARDASGNTSMCQFNVLVEDTVPPQLECPPSVVRAATSAEPVPIDFTLPQARDAVGVKAVSANPSPGSLFSVGATTVTITALDTSDHASTCTFTVYNQDVVAPSITCPGPQQVVATRDDGAAVLFPDATATDDLGPPTVLYSHEPGSTFPVGETIVTATARDLGGNEERCTFPVTVAERTGCGCQSGAAGASVFWLLLALMPLWARRRAARLAR